MSNFMSNVFTKSAWLVPGLLLLPLSSTAAPAPVFTSKVTATPAAVKTGKPANVSVSLVNAGPAVAKGNVDLEVYNAKGIKVAQQAWAGQMLAKHHSSTYRWAWKPAKAGVYTFKLGVFSADWKTLHYWADKALVLKAS